LFFYLLASDNRLGLRVEVVYKKFVLGLLGIGLRRVEIDDIGFGLDRLCFYFILLVEIRACGDVNGRTVLGHRCLLLLVNHYLVDRGDSNVQLHITFLAGLTGRGLSRLLELVRRARFVVTNCVIVLLFGDLNVRIELLSWHLNRYLVCSIVI